MAITFTNLGASANPDINDSSDLASYVNTSWTPPGSGLIIVGVYNRRTTGAADTPTMSGNGLTWTNIITLVPTADTPNSRMTLFGANASGSTTGATTVDFGGNAQLGCTASFFSADVDLSGGVAAAFVQTATGQAGTGTTGTVTLAAPASANNRPIVFFWHFLTEAVTPRVNWTEADNFTGAGPNRGLDTQYRTDAFEVTATATWATSTSWAGIAAELKDVTAAGATVVDPFGMSGFFGG